jgi:hypothetical protein
MLGAVLGAALWTKLVAVLGLELGPELGTRNGSVRRTRRVARFTTGIGARGDSGSSTRLCTRVSTWPELGVALGWR